MEEFMKEIVYLKGDATNPMVPGPKIIAHICNDIGGWGKGFVLALSKKWAEPEIAYRKWYKERKNFGLGEIQLIAVTEYISVCNMIGQRGIKRGSKGVPIRYEAVESCLEKLSQIAIEKNASIHMPRIGCGLAGGKWARIEPIIAKTLSANNVAVYVYDFD
jgi:O-acetyl-ADP-ribose deacetylase (regulator of RNase III)